MSEDGRFWDRDEASAKDTWQTPEEITSTLQKHIDLSLDPCAGLYTFICRENWTIEEDGRVYEDGDKVLRTGINSLEAEWEVDGGIAYINPPFSMKEQFIEKAIDEIENGNIDGAVVLTPDSTDVKSWWHSLLVPNAPIVWFSKGRISFIDPDSGEERTNPTFGTALHFLGPIDVWPESLFCDLNEVGDVRVRWDAIDAGKLLS